MERRNFMTTLGLGLPAATLFLSAKPWPDRQTEVLSETEQKVLRAMLTMQRASWEQGVALHALMEAGLDDWVVLMAHEACLRSLDDGRLAMLSSVKNVTDPVSNGPGVFRAFQLTEDEAYRLAAEKLLNYCLNEAPKASNGALYHLVDRPEVWSDSIYMTLPFLTVMGKYDEAFGQLQALKHYLWNIDKQLYHHRFNCEKGEFVNRKFWGGGNGWVAAALAWMIDILPYDRMIEKEMLADHLILLVEGCLAHMRPDGLFHDVIDDPTSFVETNLSQMLAYAIFKAVKAEGLGTSYLEPALAMRAAALKQIDSWGFVQGACSSPRFDRPGTSTEAQAFCLLMEAAHRNLIH